jgi:hypothetical protein
LHPRRQAMYEVLCVCVCVCVCRMLLAHTGRVREHATTHASTCARTEARSYAQTQAQEGRTGFRGAHTHLLPLLLCVRPEQCQHTIGVPKQVVLQRGVQFRAADAPVLLQCTRRGSGQWSDGGTLHPTTGVWRIQRATPKRAHLPTIAITPPPPSRVTCPHTHQHTATQQHSNPPATAAVQGGCGSRSCGWYPLHTRA